MEESDPKVIDKILNTMNKKDWSHYLETKDNA